MKKERQQQSRERYTAMLLFQFRVVCNGVSNRRRLCEKRLILLEAQDGREALKIAQQRGSQSEHCYANSDGNQVHFEFVGVLDLLHLGVECEADEVWYQICEIMEPDTRRSKLIPDEQTLQAISEDRQRKSENRRRKKA